MGILRLALAGLLACLCGCGEPVPAKRTILTILHVSDGESHLMPRDKYPGFAKFAAHWRWIREQQRQAGHGVLAVCAGDNFLPSLKLKRSYESGNRHGFTCRESLALRLLRFDAIALGNHDFDLGPWFLAAFIKGNGIYRNPFFGNPDVHAEYQRAGDFPPFLSANCNFSDEPALASLAKSGCLRGSMLVTIKGIKVGVIGLVTPTLPSISTANRVRVRTDLSACVNEQATQLREQGVTLCVLVSHLQGIEHERALIPQLRGVDVVVAGGGEEYLGAKDSAPDDVEFAGAYPQQVTAADGRAVRLVTAPGGYRFIGALSLELDEHGRIKSAQGAVHRPARGTPSPAEQELVAEPKLLTLYGMTLACVDVPLDGRREALRTGATNLGSLIADALLHAAGKSELPPENVSGVVALVNAGAIRLGKVLKGGFARPSVERMLPYPNELVRVTVTRETLRDLLEHAAAAHGKDEGTFAQIGGMAVVYDISKDLRVRSVRLPGDPSVDIVRDGVVVPGSPVHVITSDFLVTPRGDTGRGGDGYPFGKTPRVVPVGTTPVKATMAYIVGPLKGKITAARYPTAQTRIQIVE